MTKVWLISGLGSEVYLRIKDRADFNICGTEFFGFPFFDENQLFEVF